MPRAKTRDNGDMLVATESGVVNVKGEDFPFTRGVTRFRASHPVVKQCPGFFKPIEAHYDVEQTTAAPGEKRTG